MTTCILSPYGTYDTVESCNSSEICGMRWRCARYPVDGVYEKDPVTGQDVLPGNPILAHDGTFDTAEEVKCYECVVDMGNETAECKATDGVQGTSPDDTCGGTCNYGYDCEEGDLVWKQDGGYGPELTSCDYVCGIQGERLLVQPGETYPESSSWENLKCYTCDPSASTPLPANAGTVGYIDANEVCTYTCENGEKVFDTSGRTTEELKCYQCTGGTTSEPVDGVDGYLDAGEGCLYACDEGEKVYVESGGVSNYNSFGCYECTGGHEYTPVQGDGKGYTAGGFDNDGGKCWYWCNDESSPGAIPRDVRDEMEDPSLVSKPTMDEVACWTCEGNPGPDSGCAQVTQGVGQFSSAETCDTDSGAQCGWGYGCENDSCAITSSATRGRTEEECKMDSVAKCGWGYGCFNKFACVDGVSCAPVPDEECTVDGGADGKLVCHDSADECVENSACSILVVDCPDNPLLGEWEQDRYRFSDGSKTFVSEFPTRNFTFDRTDEDGYQWWKSGEQNISGETLSELGILYEVQGTEQVVYVKMRGVAQWTGTPQPEFQYYPFASISSLSSQGGSYDVPEAYEVSRIGLGECYSPDLIRIPFILVGYDVDKVGHMSFENIASTYSGGARMEAVKCPDNPFHGKWRLVNGNTGEKVYDGADFDLNYTGTNVDGDRRFESSVKFGGSPSDLIFGDFIDEETGNRIISIFVTARPYSADYESYGVGEAQRYQYFATSGGGVYRGPGQAKQYALATIPPDSPDFYGCVEIDEIDLSALCDRRTEPGACISPALGYPLVLERVL
jgi:hypothetical protein